MGKLYNLVDKNLYFYGQILHFSCGDIFSCGDTSLGLSSWTKNITDMLKMAKNAIERSCHLKVNYF